MLHKDIEKLNLVLRSWTGILKVKLIEEGEIVKYCPHCGWPESEPFVEASRHRTAAGQTVWTRCVCGSLQMRVVTATGARVVARSRPQDQVAVRVPANCR
jgi:hypothetical protein